MRGLVPGATGFIDFYLGSKLEKRGEAVVGLDNLDGYRDEVLNYACLKQLEQGLQRFAARYWNDYGVEEKVAS